MAVDEKHLSLTQVEAYAKSTFVPKQAPETKVLRLVLDVGNIRHQLFPTNHNHKRRCERYGIDDDEVAVWIVDLKVILNRTDGSILVRHKHRLRNRPLSLLCPKDVDVVMGVVLLEQQVDLILWEGATIHVPCDSEYLDMVNSLVISPNVVDEGKNFRFFFWLGHAKLDVGGELLLGPAEDRGTE